MEESCAVAGQGFAAEVAAFEAEPLDAGDVEFEVFVGESEGAVFVGGHYA